MADWQREDTTQPIPVQPGQSLQQAPAPPPYLPLGPSEVGPEWPEPHPPQRRQRSPARFMVAVVLVLLSAAAWIGAAVAVGTYATVTDTERFVASVGPVVEEPAVTAVVGDRVAEAAMAAAGITRLVERVFPASLEDEVAAEAERRIGEYVQANLESPEFRAAWDALLAESHAQAIAIVRGDSAAAGVTVSVLPLVPVALNAALPFLDDLLGRPLAFPDDLPADPDAARDYLEERYDVRLPPDFAELTLVTADQLAEVRDGYRVLGVLAVALPVLAALLTVLLLVVARSRLASLVAVLALTAIGLGMLVWAFDPVATVASRFVADESLREAVAATVGVVLRPLGSLALLLLASGVVLLVVVLVLHWRGRARPA